MQKYLVICFIIISVFSCQSSKEKARVHVEKGIEILYKSHFQEAIAEFELAIIDDPANFEAYHYKGAAYANQGNFGQAIESYKKAIEVNPKYADSYFNLGLIFENQADRASACKYFLKAEELGKPNMSDYTKWCK